MRAVWYSANGEARSVLQSGDLPVPEPGPGEVRVKLAVSGVNPSDVKSRAGSRPVTVERLIPHSDGAGLIDQVGPGVPKGRLGERVWIWNGQWRRAMGTAAEYIVLPSQQAVHLHDATTFEQGACLGIPALTAIHAVGLAGDLVNKTVLVIGASSCVGFYAAQIARLRGARVIGTVGSAEKADLVRSVGIDDLIEYKKEPVADRVHALTDGCGVDAVIDMDFSTTAQLVPVGAVAPHGTIICYGSNRPDEVPIAFWSWLQRSISLRCFLVYDLLPRDRQIAQDALQDLLRESRLIHHIGPVFSLDEVVQAHEAVESGRVMGNVIVRCSA